MEIGRKKEKEEGDLRFKSEILDLRGTIRANSCIPIAIGTWINIFEQGKAE